MAHLPLTLAEPLANIASSAGISADQVRFVLCLLTSIPLGFIHKRLPSATVKHIFSIFWGVFYCWFVTDLPGVYHPFISSAIVYLMAMVLPYKKLGFSVFIFSMIYMSASHIYRMYTNWLGWNLDFTTQQMMVTVKLCTFAYNWEDGQTVNKGEKLHHQKEHIHHFRENRAVTKLPNVIEFFSYIFFFGGVLAGPCYELREYLEFTNGVLWEQYKLKKAPSSLMATIKCVIKAFGLYSFVVVGGIFGFGLETLKTEAFLTHPSFLYRYSYTFVTIALTRFKYYFAWKLSEASCVASAFGFNGFKDGKSRWDRVTNANARYCEMATSLPMLTNNWNMGVNHWLKHYVYNRLPGKNRTLNNVITKLTSAFWHGFYPGYYMFFGSAVLIDMCGTRLAKIFRPMFYTTDKHSSALIPKSAVGDFIYNLVAWWMMMSQMNYLGAAFMLLDAYISWKLWTALYFYFFVASAVILVFTSVFTPKRAKKDESSKKHFSKSSSDAAPAASPKKSTRSKKAD